MEKTLKYSSVSMGVSVLFAILFCVTLATFWYQLKISTERKIIRDISILVPIFEKIHKDAVITGFKHTHNFIDFLNVISFEGSEVGSMVVKYPKKWKGPYVRDNPTVQAKMYEVVRTKKGYYLIPGRGVKINKFEIGKDIIINEDNDPENYKQLYFHGKPLFAPLILESPMSNELNDTYELS